MQLANTLIYFVIGAMLGAFMLANEPGGIRLRWCIPIAALASAIAMIVNAWKALP